MRDRAAATAKPIPAMSTRTAVTVTATGTGAVCPRPEDVAVAQHAGDRAVALGVGVGDRQAQQSRGRLADVDEQQRGPLTGGVVALDVPGEVELVEPGVGAVDGARLAAEHLALVGPRVVARAHPVGHRLHGALQGPGPTAPAVAGGER